MSDDGSEREGDDNDASSWVASRMPALAVLVFVVAGAAVLIWRLGEWSAREGHVDVTVPQFSPLARAGQEAFAENCAKCHGNNASGGVTGPPLVHAIYNPGHHADAAFVMAVRRGVRQHHWQFGNMPPQPQVTDQEITAIIRYVRELQVANGVRYREHRMQ